MLDTQYLASRYFNPEPGDFVWTLITSSTPDPALLDPTLVTPYSALFLNLPIAETAFFESSLPNLASLFYHSN